MEGVHIPGTCINADMANITLENSFLRSIHSQSLCLCMMFDVRTCRIECENQSHTSTTVVYLVSKQFRGEKRYLEKCEVVNFLVIFVVGLHNVRDIPLEHSGVHGSPGYHTQKQLPC